MMLPLISLLKLSYVSQLKKTVVSVIFQLSFKRRLEGVFSGRQKYTLLGLMNSSSTKPILSTLFEDGQL